METIKFSYEKALDKEAVRSVAGEAAAAQKTLPETAKETIF